jgi:putative membrane protein
MLNVDDKMRADIRKAVEDLEKSTRGELVCVVAQSCADYMLFPLLWAAVIALFLPMLNILGAEELNVTFATQGLVFVGLAALFLLTPLKVKLTPRSVLESNCHRTACEQFYAQKLHETQKRSGLLLFVSVAEHYVELLADTGISEKVWEGEWDGIVGAFASDIRAGRVHEGFLKAIEACKNILAAHFPGAGEVNELSDHLVELPKAEYVN